MLDYIAPQMNAGTKHDIRLPDPVPYYEGRLGDFNLGNLSAWLQDRPLIIRFKDALGQLMIDFVFMVAAVRFPEANNLADVLLYFEQVGYLDFENNLSYAIASLQFAEYFDIENLYQAAFLRCVRLSTALYLAPSRSAEFQVRDLCARTPSFVSCF
ncbi:hypothetical protein G7054_g6663 [Neopestalotiopsis clavispora]|nr:hypothetical protein G7054_g6663 [Neopestalotiopsis clavispora]